MHPRPRLLSLTTVLSERARAAVHVTLLALTLAVAGLALSDLGLFGHGAVERIFNDWVYNGAELTAAALVLSRALLVRGERRAWRILALGIALFAAGDVYYTLVLEPMSNPPTPSPSDAGYLAFYVCAYAMMMMIVRVRVRTFHASMWLDGAIGGFSVAAIGATLVLEPVINVTHGPFAAVATNLAYPLGDLLLLAFVVSVFALTGWRPGRAWLLMGLGFATLAIADSVYLFRVAEGTYAAGTILDALWPGGLLLLAYAAWCEPREREEIRFEGLAVIVAPVVFALPALLLLIRANYVHMSVIPESLATAALIAAGARFASTFNDVRKLSNVREHLARTDELTGLANRRHFYASLKSAVDGCTLRKSSFALLMIDLDRFKELNDTLGHHAGDLLLAQFGPRLQTVLRGGAIARLGGDEFGVIVREADGAQGAAERIQDALRAPFKLEGLGVSVQASVGIALFPRDAKSAEKLLQCADVAMYQAKDMRTRFAFYSPRSDHNSRVRLGLVSELKGAIEQGQLVVHYQPQIDLRSGDVRGVEALVRWAHPERGLLAPDTFIDLAENSGVMRELTASVLEQALAQQHRWLCAGRELAVAVNVSATNLVDPGFLADLHETLERSGTPARMLRLEITENVLIAEGPRVRTVLESLADLGVQLTLDDFGTGYSSLAYLRELPVGEIKIDRSFVAEMMSDSDTATIVESTIALAGRLGMDVVAEGIETPEQLELLRSQHCPLGQGYLFSRPMPVAGVERWLALRDAQKPEPRRSEIPAPSTWATTFN